MDHPGLDRTLHHNALRGLGRIHAWSCTVRKIGVTALSLLDSSREPVRMLDLACGGGQIVQGLHHWSQSRRLTWRIDGCDISPTAIQFARTTADREGTRCRYFESDVLRQPIPAGYDILLSSLFLHHLTESEAVLFFSKLADSAQTGFVVVDLERRAAGLLLAHVATRFLTTSPVVHTDGPRSVRRAFSLGEVVRLAKSAGLRGVRLQRCWPFRWTMSWRRP